MAGMQRSLILADRQFPAMKKTLLLLSLSLLSGALLSLAFPVSGGYAPLAFLALLPLLYVEDHLDRHKDRKRPFAFLGYAYLTFMAYNLITTWWILYASVTGMALAVILNALIMAGVFLLFHLSKRTLGASKGYFALLFYWVAFEWLHMDWEASWPWLTLGNIFSTFTEWVQWYEYTGTLGGSAWVLIVNLLVFSGFRQAFLEQEKKGRAWVAPALGVLFILVPVLFSYRIIPEEPLPGDPVKVTLVQPNIDPYEEKFRDGKHFMPYEQQLQRLIDLSGKGSDSATQLIVAPETALPGGYWAEEMKDAPPVRELQQMLQEFPNARFIVGLSSYKRYADTAKRPTKSAREFSNGSGYYDAYNSAMQLQRDGDIQLYHKSRLVPGVERLPFSWLLAPLEDLAIDLGGTTGSLGVQEEPTVFTAEDGQGSVVAPLICYESIYGGYVTEYVRKGAEFLVVITNDGWWSDTPGYLQHLHMARLRAIETRRSVVRAANTGISCFIDHRGNITDRTAWWTKTALSGVVRTSNELTFYARNGDGIGRVFAFFSLLLLVFTGVRFIRDKSGIHPN